MAIPTGKLTHEQERKLVSRAQRGDKAATRDLIQLHKDRLFAFIYRMVHNHHDSEEICQDAFLKAFASLDTFSSEYRFSTWLFTIGYRVCLNRLRRKHELTGGDDALPMQEAIAPVDEESELGSEEAAQLRQVVWSAVDKLSAPQRATVLLFYRHEMGCHEIAQVLELPVATVKSHLHRARGRLKDVLTEMDVHEFSFDRNRIADVG